MLMTKNTKATGSAVSSKPTLLVNISVRMEAQFTATPPAAGPARARRADA